MSRSRGNVGRSRSRLGLKIKCLGLVSVSDHRVSFTSQCAQLFASLQNCTYIVLNARRLYCSLIHKFTYLLQCKCISRCHLVRMYSVCLGQGDIALDGNLVPPIRGTAAPPQFSARVYFGKTIAHLSYCWVLVITSDTFLHDSIKFDQNHRNATAAPNNVCRCPNWCVFSFCLKVFSDWQTVVTQDWRQIKKQS